MRRSLSLAPLVLLSLSAPAVQADESRQLGAHVHGVSRLDVAVEGKTLEMALAAPGMDIVGFEHAPSSPAGETAVAEALAALRDPLALFVLPEAAGCKVEGAEAALELEEHGHDHDEDHDHDDGHDHDDHDEKGHEHADGHDHDDAHKHDHDDHADHDHAEGGHSEFTAAYRLTCAAPDKITEVQFPYFDRFEGAQKLVLRIVTRNGAQSFDVERNSSSLSLKGKL